MIARTFLRCWGFDTALLAAVPLGVGGLLLWGEQPLLPLIRVPIPMSTLMPVLASILLTGTLRERWRDQLSTSVRPVWVVPTARFVGTQAICAVAVGLASSADPAPGVVLGLTCIGVSIAALLTIALGRAAPLALLLLAYGWFAFVAVHPVNRATSHVTPWAVFTFFGCGIAFVGWESRRRWGTSP